MSRRFRAGRKKNRRAEMWVTTVPRRASGLRGERPGNAEGRPGRGGRDACRRVGGSPRRSSGNSEWSIRRSGGARARRAIATAVWSQTPPMTKPFLSAFISRVRKAKNIKKFGDSGQDWLGGRDSLGPFQDTPMNTGLSRVNCATPAIWHFRLLSFVGLRPFACIFVLLPAQ